MVTTIYIGFRTTQINICLLNNMSLAIDRNPTLQGGYSDVSIQSETTGKGRFDHNAIRSRLNAGKAGRGRVDAYPNGANAEVMGVLPREHLIARRTVRNHHASRGEPTLAVFSSLNGMPWGKYPSLDALKRAHIYVGRSKHQFLTPTQQRGMFQHNGGLGWIETGKASCEHTGRKVIQAGDLVCLEFPPTARDASYELTPSGASFRSKSVLRGGQAVGKYLLMTEPVDPIDFGIQLMGINALMRQSRSNGTAPGIADLSFSSIYSGILGTKAQRMLTDGQDAAAGTVFGLAGCFCNMVDALQNDITQALSENTQESLGQRLAKRMGLFSEDPADRSRLFIAMDEVFKQNVAQVARRRQMMLAFKQRHANAFKDGDNGGLKNTEAPNVLYAQLCMDSLRLLFGGISNCQYEKNRWIIGKASNSAAPGDTLDIVYGMFNRVLG